MPATCGVANPVLTGLCPSWNRIGLSLAHLPKTSDTENRMQAERIAPAGCHKSSFPAGGWHLASKMCLSRPPVNRSFEKISAGIALNYVPKEHNGITSLIARLGPRFCSLFLLFGMSGKYAITAALTSSYRAQIIAQPFYNQIDRSRTVAPLPLLCSNSPMPGQNVVELKSIRCLPPQTSMF